MKFGAQSEVLPLKSVLLRRPDQLMRQASDTWQALHWGACPDLSAAKAEYDQFVDLIARSGTEIHFAEDDDSISMDAIYVRDASLVTDAGAVICRMGKGARDPEPANHRRWFEKNGIPVAGEITGSGMIEGGDVIWLDQRTMGVAEGYRSNAEGIRQLREMLADHVDEIIPVPLPHWNGPDDILHLMSFISPVDQDLALVWSRQMSVPFRQLLLDRGITLIEVPDDEYDTMACNVLALAPRHCLMIDGNPETRRLLEAAGCQVDVYKGAEISAKGFGGPTCLTRPLLRA